MWCWSKICKSKENKVLQSRGKMLKQRLEDCAWGILSSFLSVLLSVRSGCEWVWAGDYFGSLARTLGKEGSQRLPRLIRDIVSLLSVSLQLHSLISHSDWQGCHIHYHAWMKSFGFVYITYQWFLWIPGPLKKWGNSESSSMFRQHVDNGFLNLAYQNHWILGFIL